MGLKHTEEVTDFPEYCSHCPKKLPRLYPDRSSLRFVSEQPLASKSNGRPLKVPLTKSGASIMGNSWDSLPALQSSFPLSSLHVLNTLNIAGETLSR